VSFAGDRAGAVGFGDPLGELLAAFEPVGDQDPSRMVDAELHDDLLRFARHRSREDAIFAGWVLAAVRRGIGVEDGYVDTIGWLAWKTGTPGAELRRIVRRAELCELLPDTGTAWTEGAITTTAVEMIAGARVKDCDAELVAMEPEFLDRAMRGDHQSLKILTQHFKECARADGSKPAPPDGLTMAEVGDRFVRRGDLAKTSAQSIREVLTKFTRPPTADDTTTLAQRQAEGFVRMCEIALARGTDAEGSRPVVSYITHERTADDVTAPVTLGLFTGVIDPRERDRILCDSFIIPVTTNEAGEILDVGRATSVWPRAIRRAMTSRSPHCQWPGCEIPAPWCDAHHFQHWEHGGETSLANGVHLCRRHHTFLHQHRDWTSTFERQHLRVFRPDGTEVHADPWHGYDAA
jgi:hypothetical protein